MNKALFLDRDGTINVDYGYVHEPSRFVFIDGIFEFCREAQKKGYLIVVITSQSGIERGFFTEMDFASVTRHMKEEFAKEGVTITDVFHCPSLSGPDRKPEPGLLRMLNVFPLKECITERISALFSINSRHIKKEPAGK